MQLYGTNCCLQNLEFLIGDCAAQITIMYSNPVLVALLAWALRGEMLSAHGCAGIAVTLLGVVVVAQPPSLFGGHEWSPARLAGDLLSMIEHKYRQ